jgi:Holliday junction resolvase RusA-like endonuclease
MNHQTMKFEFPFRAVPRKSTKFRKNGFSYKDPESAKFERSVKEYAKLQAGGLTPRSGQLRAYYGLFFARPRSTKFKYPPRPDADNCVKAIADALQGVVFLTHKFLSSR